jgi:hypothetical protein
MESGKLAHRGMQLHKGLGAQEGTRAVGGLAADDITDRQRTTSTVVGCVVAGVEVTYPRMMLTAEKVRVRMRK